MHNFHKRDYEFSGTLIENKLSTNSCQTIYDWHSTTFCNKSFKLKVHALLFTYTHVELH